MFLHCFLKFLKVFFLLFGSIDGEGSILPYGDASVKMEEVAIPVKEVVAPFIGLLPPPAYWTGVEHCPWGEVVFLLQGQCQIFFRVLFLRKPFPHALVIGKELVVPNGERRVHIPQRSVPGNALVHLVHPFENNPCARQERQDEGVLRDFGAIQLIKAAILLEERCGFFKVS